jgi:hypothetical protein
MKRLTISVIMAAVLTMGLVTPAMAVSSQNYSVILPRFGSAYYSSAKTVSAYRDYGVRHRYSGGKTVNFQVCDSQRNVIGSRVAVKPGGKSAPLVDLWYNNSASAKTVCVKMTTPLTTAVEVLAEGTWYWNY